MVHIDKGSIDVPDILHPLHPKNKSNKATTVLQEAFDAQIPFKFDSKLYGHKSVKEVLKKIQHGKCCFCESKVTHIAHGDVEHYRPKSRYYWLAYNFENLYFCCQICNQAYKRDYFPLREGSAQAQNHYDAHLTELEAPLIVDPGKENPAEHIFFNREVPIAITDKGKHTIKRTGLDREHLDNARLQWYKLIDDIARHAREGDKISLKLLRDAASPDQEYSLMVKCNFGELL